MIEDPPAGIEVVLEMGNHDMAYRYPTSMYAYCSGFTKDKSDAINSVMSRVHWEQFKFAVFEQGWLISHAGAHPWVFGEDMTPESVIADCDKAAKTADESPRTWCAEFGAGEARGGPRGSVGGITWLDFNREFKCVPGINQLVGHTPHAFPSSAVDQESRNHCLDTHSKHVYILENGNLKIIENKWLPPKPADFVVNV